MTKITPIVILESKVIDTLEIHDLSFDPDGMTDEEVYQNMEGSFRQFVLLLTDENMIDLTLKIERTK